MCIYAGLCIYSVRDRYGAILLAHMDRETEIKIHAHLPLSQQPASLPSYYCRLLKAIRDRVSQSPDDISESEIRSWPDL